MLAVHCFAHLSLDHCHHIVVFLGGGLTTWLQHVPMCSRKRKVQHPASCLCIRPAVWGKSTVFRDLLIVLVFAPSSLMKRPLSKCLSLFHLYLNSLSEHQPICGTLLSGTPDTTALLNQSRCGSDILDGKPLEVSQDK